MTRKHFKALAEALRERRPQPHWDPNKLVQWDHDRRAVADVCAAFNGKFDRNRFYAATEEP